MQEQELNAEELAEVAGGWKVRGYGKVLSPPKRTKVKNFEEI